MQGQKYSVWFEAERWEPGGWMADDCNTDVRVDFEEGGTWVTTCFTYKNILSLAVKNQVTGECLDGKYFWATDMVLVDEVSRERLEQLIEYWIRTHEFERIFTKLPSAV